jgi:UDPglucose 6-dehydrogenase
VDLFIRGKIRWLADLVQQRTVEAAGILGLTYKAGTDVVEEAAGFLLAKELASRGVKVIAYDPAYSTNSTRPALEGVCFASSARDCIREADVVVLATPWPEFGRVPATEWTGANGQPRTVVDCWRAVKFLREQPGVHYLALGMGEGFA